MKIVFLICISILSLNSWAEMSLNKCQEIADKAFFEMTTGSIGCNTAYAMGSDQEVRITNEGKCQFTLILEESVTEMGCGKGPQISFLPKKPLAILKFNRLCKKSGFQKIGKYRNEFGDRLIICQEK